jgi:hypothetical protein
MEVYCYTFLLLPIFRTGLIHFCHPCPFWNCILSFFYTSPFLELYYYNRFSTDTFRNVLLHFLLPIFLASFIEVYCYTFLLPPIFRTGLIHFCHPSQFWNCILPFFYTSPFLELYYYTYHSILLSYHFSPNTFKNVLLQFVSPTFSSWFHGIVLLHFSTVPIFPYFPLDCSYSFTLLWYSFITPLPYLLFSLL